ncbi:MAG: alpha-glucuronidase, partial [Alicyclobacillus sp.]|nr:alpha-glucuronidase [Alicyclobacillus sp.]
MTQSTLSADAAWLRCWPLDAPVREAVAPWLQQIVVQADHTPVLDTAVSDLARSLSTLLQHEVPVAAEASDGTIVLMVDNAASVPAHDEGFHIRSEQAGGGRRIVIGARTDRGLLYGVYHLLRQVQLGQKVDSLDITEQPKNPVRMLNHWDNLDGSIERGYAGRSIFFRDGQILTDNPRIPEYARLLASVGINAVAINNVNVHHAETELITTARLPEVAKLADIFRSYGIRLFLSVNYASPMQLAGLDTADPLDPRVAAWWRDAAAEIYRHIPDFGGLLVKADSEGRPGPFTYGRDHADGANMLADAVAPFGGTVIWRCFVYNHLQDWRDRSTDRARAAYDHFQPLDGRFADNVILQIKNGPMDFQVREPVSPLLGAMPRTNQMLELQITQEYTGQQRHLCYLLPQWQEVVRFDTYVKGTGSTVAKAASGALHGRRLGGFAAVSNIGDDVFWTGHVLAQANLYGYGRLAWDPDLAADDIATEWTRLTFGSDERVVGTVVDMLMASWSIYESYTAPLGVGWMVNPNHHYGPNVDGYEYSKWGTYHFGDRDGIGVDRTQRSGTGYTAQY